MKLSLKVHPTTYIILLITFILGLFKTSILILSIVIIHEFGHAIIAKIFKRKIETIIILPFGGLTIIDGNISTNIFEDLLISVGGFLFQIIIFLVNFWLYKNNYISIKLYQNIIFYNTIIISFNLLPIYPLDGAKILEHFLELFIPFRYVIYPFIIINIITIICYTIYNGQNLKSNVLIILFMTYLIYKKIKNYKFILNRFYLERMIYKYPYPIITISTFKKMYKNKCHIICGITESNYLKEYHFKSF